jgi:hypothetical protein
LIVRKDPSYFTASPSGRVAEWLMAPVLKTGIPERVSGVRIPSLPPHLSLLGGYRGGNIPSHIGRFVVKKFVWYPCGEMAEWLKAHAWKACIG